ncbi:hypothetical protein EKO04_004121 [Ascochyta lentis]|uniref:Uncharacterized protein n=1 Tax=Ascochyta lentis TaxID=205686 RepID=A0A8H7J7F8_9PLEO|nr:hypothetical protein EKO04_004121 [Ascochyta lentis]
MPTTIFDCFQQEHATYPRKDGTLEQDTKRKATSSSTGTDNATPPKLLVKRASTYWTQKANTFLQSNRTALQRECVAEDEKLRARAELRIEADVVRVSYTYITHPIANAINVRYRTPVTVKAEEKSDRYRHDLSFNIHQDDSHNRKTIMIIEFKRIGLIKYEQFTEAMREEQDIRETLDELEEDGELTTLASSALVLTKQAAAYADNWECPYVALCDFDRLVLLRLDLKRDIAHATTVQRKDIRKALLGFLVEACEYAGVT